MTFGVLFPQLFQQCGWSCSNAFLRNGLLCALLGRKGQEDFLCWCCNGFLSTGSHCIAPESPLQVFQLVKESKRIKGLCYAL